MLKCCLYIFILRESGKLSNPKENSILFFSSQVPFFRRLSDVSASEMKTRFLGVLGYWTFQYMVIDVLNAMLAVSTVALRLTSVDVWPPFFGSVDEAWSLRQFWG